METSDQAMGPGAGTRHLLSLTVQDFEEVVKVTKPEPDLDRLIAKTEAVKVLDHDMVMEVEYCGRDETTDGDEAAVLGGRTCPQVMKPTRSW